MTAGGRLPVVVLISGSGSNLQAILDAQHDGWPFEVKAVISNRADAYGLERAATAGVPTQVLDHKTFPDRESYDRALIGLIDAYRPALVILAGFMRILSRHFVNHFEGRLLNIHPSLLPEYRGLNTHQRVLQAKDQIHGATVHLVTEELDSGPLILQVRVPVTADDTEASLAARVLSQEHIIYPTVIRWFAEGRLRLEQGTLHLDGEAMHGPAIMEYTQNGTA